MKRTLVILSVMLLIVSSSSALRAQQISSPFLVQLQIGDSLIPIGKPITLPQAGTQEVRVVISNAAGNSGSQFIAKEIVLESPRQMGSSTLVARHKVPSDQGSNFSLGSVSVGGQAFTLQYTIPTIYEVRNGKTRSITAPLSKRSFVIRYQ